MAGINDNKRAPNFSALEESLLVSLVSKYKDIIECKKTDSEANFHKKDIWKKIAEEFNSSVEIPRTDLILRNKYRNLKKRSKQKLAEERMYAQGTGGGPQKTIVITDGDEEIKVLIGNQMTGDTSEFDDDSAFVVLSEDDNAPNTAAPKHDMNITDNGDCREPVNPPSTSELHGTKRPSDWTSYTPAKLKRPVSAALATPSSSRMTNKFSNKITSWLDSKNENANIQNQLLLEQHQLKMGQMAEMHQLQLEMAKEEHAMKMLILKKELENKP